jgi:trehalose/maltose hydrolase-like predicted phosphorylase
MATSYFTPEDWAVSEDRYRPDLNRFLETIFFTGNGYLGVRGTPEEWMDAANSSPVNFVAPIYDLVKSWPDGLVTYVSECSVTVACPNWFRVELTLAGERFAPQAGTLVAYRRSLDLQTATLTRILVWEDGAGRRTELSFVRFVSQDNLHLAAITVACRPLNWSGTLEIATDIDGTSAAQQEIVGVETLADDGAALTTRTKVTGFETVTAMRTGLFCDEAPVGEPLLELTAQKAIVHYHIDVTEGQTLRLEKLVAVCVSRDAEEGTPTVRADAMLAQAKVDGMAAVYARHCAAVSRIWQAADVVIDGDAAAQQGIRFCILNMYQNFAGIDPRLNMAAKGLSGPGYGGLYWWDSEIYMMPYFLYSAPEKAKNLVMYRYLTLAGAREKARIFGYDGALYPWVTIDGVERSGDWQYGMLEQHVSSAVAHAVAHYVDATGDEDFLWECGVEMLIETSRFWASRVVFSARKERYVINHITGPDEYAVAVNNNCYCNVMAKANLELGCKAASRMQREQPTKWDALVQRLGLTDEEITRWREIAADLFIPFNAELGIHEQDDNFLDRAPVVWRDVPAERRPAGRWNWHRLMSSQAMKQADVLLLMFLKHDCFDRETKRTNYEFYEPKTTHESSLSPCIHAIIAAEVGLDAEAFDYYLRSARLDLDDVNGNTDQGLHIANTAGSWISITSGFAGMRQAKGELSFTPHLPRQWARLAFALSFRGRRLAVELTPDALRLTLHDGAPLTVTVAGTPVALIPGQAARIPTTAASAT